MRVDLTDKADLVFTWFEVTKQAINSDIPLAPGIYEHFQTDERSRGQIIKAQESMALGMCMAFDCFKIPDDASDEDRTRFDALMKKAEEWREYWKTME